jgi:hypothetical protein
VLVGAFSNAAQVFNRNAGRKRLSCFNDALRDVVVNPSLKASLPARQPLQQLTASPPATAGALTGLTLEGCSQSGKAAFYLS